MDLSSLAVVFVLASEGIGVEALEHLGDALCWMRQHRLHRNARLDFAEFRQLLDAVLEEDGNHGVIGRTFAVSGLDDESVFLLTRFPRLGAYAFAGVEDGWREVLARGSLRRGVGQGWWREGGDVEENCFGNLWSGVKKQLE